MTTNTGEFLAVSRTGGEPLYELIGEANSSHEAAALRAGILTEGCGEEGVNRYRNFRVWTHAQGARVLGLPYFNGWLRSERARLAAG